MKIAHPCIGLTLVSALALAGPANAGADVGSWYVSPEYLYVFTDDELRAGDDDGYRLAIGRVMSENWDVELAHAQTRHSADAGGQLKLGFTEVDFRRVFYRDQRFNPFLDLGLGVVRTRYALTNGGSSSRAGAKLGVGFLFGAASSARVQLVGSAGIRLDGLKGVNSARDPYLGLGLRFNFGGTPAAAAVTPPPEPVPVVEPPAPPPPPAPPADSDGDGVPDSADRCPNTPTGATVDANGCELDGDQDGVINRLDRCPNTPAGDKVDAVGCGLTIALQVNFDTNSANIKPDSFGALDDFVEFLKAVPSARGTLEGHTDSVGSAAYNRGLSQRRADSVKTYVVGKGIDGSRLTARGYGESQPIADNSTADGRAQNRRVLFTRTSLQQ